MALHKPPPIFILSDGYYCFQMVIIVFLCYYNYYGYYAIFILLYPSRNVAVEP